MTDLIVVGGGIVGLCAALRAAEAAMRVTLIDAGTNAGSTTNAGSLHVQLQSRFMRLYPEQAHNVEASLPFYLEAVKEWERLADGLGSMDLVRQGGLMLGEDAAQLEFLAAKAQREAAAGLSVEMLDRRALEVLAPWLGPQIIGAELCHDEGKLNPLLANRLLRERAEKLGVRFIRDRVIGIEAVSPLVVTCERARYAAEQVLIAAAWGSGNLLRPLGLVVQTRAEPLHMNITEPAASAIHHLVQHAERSITLKQLQTGQIVIGGGWPASERPGGGVPKVRSDSLLGNVGLAGRLVPGLRGLRVIRSWAGMNTTVDGKSTLGRLPGQDRVLLAVPGDAGYTLGPLCGRVIAEVAAGITVDHDLQPFSPQRFMGA
ncbi:MAG: FAD-dependent oxidoreductase [Pseudomonadota bacterium]